jgi:Protein of Unknown function (DUF2604)
MSDNQIAVNVIVNGQPVSVQANIKAPLRTLVEHALHDSGNSGQPTENWELRDAAGHVLDLTRKLEDSGIAAGANLFLNLKAGVGG